MNKLLSVKNLTKSFDGKPAIDEISTSLEFGGKAALIGPDGAGKTTFLRLLSGLLIPDNYNEETVQIAGVSPYSNLNLVKKSIGYMPQAFGLYEDLSVMENLELYAGLKNVPKNEQNELFEKLLKFAGLTDFKKRLSGALSGGMKQKLGLSCTLLSRPKLLLLDEPSVGVDPVSRQELIKITDDLARESKIGIIWATSYLDEAKFFDKAILFSNGRKIFEGGPNNAARAMDGLVYLTNEKNINNRILLDNIIQNSNGLVDAAIEGDKIRVIFENSKAANNFGYKKIQTAPVFEDFVMGALGAKIEPKNDEIKDIKENPPEGIAIEALDLTKKYGDFTAAHKINFKVKKGEIYGLLGPNGAGKSTTFKMLCGLIKSSGGSSKVMGCDIKTAPIQAKKNFGYMAQKFSLFGNLSVKSNIEFFAGVLNVPKKNWLPLIKDYELEKYLNYDAAKLPLGYKQRLALLCAVIHSPPVLFLDEPTSGVDPVSRREFWMRINNLVKHKTTVLVTTHFMDEAQFCNRIALVYKGEILVEDTPDNLKNSVKSPLNLNPTMEDAFIEIIKLAEKKSGQKAP